MSTFGRMTSIAAISGCPVDTSRRDRGNDVVFLRHGRPFQDRVVGNGHVRAAETHDRRFEHVEHVAFRDHRGDFGADAHRLHAFVHDEQPMRLADACGDRRKVDRTQRAQVDHFGVDAFGGESLRGRSWRAAS